MSFLFYLKVKKIVLMIFSPILNVIDPNKKCFKTTINCRFKAFYFYTHIDYFNSYYSKQYT